MNNDIEREFVPEIFHFSQIDEFRDTMKHHKLE